MIIKWIINALALLGIAYYLPGVGVDGIYAALVTALILGLINAVLGTILKILTLPINILTLGLFGFVINGLMFWFASTIVQGFSVDGFWPAFWGALIMTVVGWMVNGFLKRS